MQRLTYNEFHLWFATDNTPAPLGSVPNGHGIKIRIGVSPYNPKIKIKIRYSVRKSDWFTTFRHRVFTGSLISIYPFTQPEEDGGVAYFDGAFPSIPADTEIEYSIECEIDGKPVKPSEPNKFNFTILPVQQQREVLSKSNPLGNGKFKRTIDDLEFQIGSPEIPPPNGPILKNEPEFLIYHELPRDTQVRLVLQYSLNNQASQQTRLVAESRKRNDGLYYPVKFPPLAYSDKVEFTVSAILRKQTRVRKYILVEDSFSITRSATPNNNGGQPGTKTPIDGRTKPVDLDNESYKDYRSIAVLGLRDRIEEVLGEDAAKKLQLSQRLERLNDAEVLERSELDALIRAKIKGEAQLEVIKKLRALPPKMTISDTLRPGVAITANSYLSQGIYRQEMESLLRIAGISSESNSQRCEDLLAVFPNTRAVTHASLKREINAQRLDESEARRLGFSANLNAMLDGNVQLTSSIVESLTELGDIKSLRDIARFSSKRLSERLPQDESGSESHLAGPLLKIRKSVEYLYPGTALIHSNIANANVDTAIQETESDITKIARENLTGLFPGLGIENILSKNENSNYLETRTQVNDKLQRLAEFERANEHVNLLTHDLAIGGSGDRVLDFGDSDRAEREALLRVIKSYQRAYRLTGNIENAATLLKSGLSSASDVRRLSSPENLSEMTKLPLSMSIAIYEAANVTVSIVGSMGSAVFDQATGFDDNLLQWPLPLPDTKSFLKDIEGYDDLFGNLGTCQCEHCKSILSPAAYFVDLMHFVSTNVTSKYFAGANEKHALALKQRRLDLWNVPLTCASTDIEVPTLELINPVLENLIFKFLPGYDASTIPTPTEIRKRVEEAVAQRVDSFEQPYAIPLQLCHESFRALDQSWHGLAQQLLLPVDLTSKELHRLAMLRLQLSIRQWELIVTPVETPEFLSKYFEVDLSNEDYGNISNVDATQMRKRMGIPRSELSALVGAVFVNKNQIGRSESKVIGIGTGGGVQNDHEIVTLLTARRLDRIHRMARLRRVLPEWTVLELDLALTSLDTAGIGTELDNAMLEGIADVSVLQELFSLNIEETCALFADLSTRPVTASGTSLLHKRFSPQSGSGIEIDEPWPDPSIDFTHPGFNSSGSVSEQDQVSLGRLTAATNSGDTELLELIRVLSTPLNAVSQSSNSDALSFKLSLKNLSLLYRHARLAGLLTLSIDELSSALALLGLECISIPRDVFSLNRLVKQFRANNNNFQTIKRITLPIEHPHLKTDKKRLVIVASKLRGRLSSKIAAKLQKVKLMEVSGLSAKQLDSLVAAATGLENSQPEDGYITVSAAYDSNSLNWPDETTSEAKQLTEALFKSKTPQSRFEIFLGNYFSLPTPSIQHVISLTDSTLSDPDIEKIIRLGSPNVQDNDPGMVKLRNFLDTIFRITSLASELRNLPITEIPSTLDLNKEITLKTLFRASQFAEFTERNSASAVRTAIDTLKNKTSLNEADATPIVNAIGGDENWVRSLLLKCSPTPNAIDTLSRLAAWRELGELHEIGPDLLAQIAYQDIDASITAISSGVLAAAAAKNGEKLVEEINKTLLTYRRDAYLSFLVHSVDGSQLFNDIPSISAYLLCDVESGACMTSSPLRFAISTVQSYVNRCILNLEQDKRAPSDPNHVHIPVKALPTSEWGWRENYRLWEANRKIFLWPESYLFPDLRDDKTPLFEELEAQLFGRDINTLAVRDAYDSYLRKFSELARLTISGSYHERGSNGDVLHLFGVTADEPPVHYYRPISNIGLTSKFDGDVSWKAWHKVEVQIPVRKVSPIIYRNQLLVFWTEIITTPQNTVLNNTTNFVGYHHEIKIKFSMLRLDGTWTAPQKLILVGDDPFLHVDGLIEDPRASAEEKKAIKKHIDTLSPYTMQLFDWDAYTEEIIDALTPRYDIKPHGKAKSDYTLRGDLWERVYPGIHPEDGLTITGCRMRFYSSIDIYRRKMGKSYGSYIEGPRTLPHQATVLKIPCVDVSEPGALGISIFTKIFPTGFVSVEPFEYQNEMNILMVDSDSNAWAYAFAENGSLVDIDEEDARFSDALNIAESDPHHPSRERSNLRKIIFKKDSYALIFGNASGPGEINADVIEPYWLTNGLGAWGALPDYRYEIEYSEVDVGYEKKTVNWKVRELFSREGGGYFLLLISRYEEGSRSGVYGTHTIRVLKANETGEFFRRPQQDELRNLTEITSAIVARTLNQYFLVTFHTDNTALLYAIDTNGCIASDPQSIAHLSWQPSDATWFRSGGRTFILLVRAWGSGSENVAIYELLSGGRISSKLNGYSIGEGWSSVRQFQVDGNQYCMFYHVSRSEIHIQTLGETLIYEGSPTAFQFDDYAHAHLVLSSTRIVEAAQLKDEPWSEKLIADLENDLYKTKLAGVDKGALLDTVNGSVGDCIIQTNGDALLLQSSVSNHRRERGESAKDWCVRRLTTTLVDKVCEELFVGGIDRLLVTETQQKLRENDIPLSIAHRRIDEISSPSILEGPFGIYYREIFLFIPWAIANNLNARGRYAEAQRWYHYIYNPTVTNENFGNSSAQRVFRYIGFHNTHIPDLRTLLTNSETMRAYREDPFNPHAIARLRPSAYAKAIVLEYVSNLLDWADELFTIYTRESIKEATLIYAVVRDILGPRPAELGSCGENEETKTFGQLQKEGDRVSAFLTELEHVIVLGFRGDPELAKMYHSLNTISDESEREIAANSITNQLKYSTGGQGLLSESDSQVAEATKKVSAESELDKKSRTTNLSSFRSPLQTHANSSKGVRAGDVGSASALNHSGQQGGRALESSSASHPSQGTDMLMQMGPQFCIPKNERLMDTWNRVDNRLHKIRNCLNIEGKFGQPALFDPALDPAELARGRSSGLLNEDLISSLAQRIPIHRFSYLVARARSAATTVQTLGQLLLVALEKQNAEELSLLRSTHEKEMLELTTEILSWEVKTAEETLEGLNEELSTKEYRRDYYQSLIDEDFNTSELTQQALTSVSAGFNNAASMLSMLGGINYLFPDVGFCMTYGGKQLGSSAEAFSIMLRESASVASTFASAAGSEAEFARRRAEWKFQKSTATKEIRKTKKQIASANARLNIARRNAKNHECKLAQTNEVLELLQKKFTNLGRYNWLATETQRLHQQMFQLSLDILRRAERALLFEHPEIESPLLGSTLSDMSEAKLLAGERLNLEITKLEERYDESDERRQEIQMSVSLRQLDPLALQRLKVEGECEINIPEQIFDLAYPGQYRRHIKSVQLTIPCLTGPYTSVSATLTLKESFVRKRPEFSSREKVPKSRAMTIATSTAKSDTGMFRLNFDEPRYLPFEGAGVNTVWRLQLPKNFRLFDYNTISDVIFEFSFSARYDGSFRNTVETDIRLLENFVTNTKIPPLKILISFAVSYPGTLQQMRIPGKTSTIEIDSTWFPYFILDREFVAATNKVGDDYVEGTAIFGVLTKGEPGGVIGVDVGTEHVELSNPSQLPGLLTGKIMINTGIVGQYEIALTGSEEDLKKVKDVVLYIAYRVNSP